MRQIIPFYTPIAVSPAVYSMVLSIDGMRLSGTSRIKWTHKGKMPLQTLLIKGEYTTLTLEAQAGYIVERDENITLITLPHPMKQGDEVTIKIEFSVALEASPFCDGDGSVLMPANYESPAYNYNMWYPMLAWDVPVCGDYTVEVQESQGYRICATGAKNGNVYTQDCARIFGLLLCKGLEYFEQTLGDVTVKAFYKAGNETAARRLADTSLDAIEFYKDLVGFYPQRSYSFLPYSSVWNGGGNWSTGIAFFHRMEQFNDIGDDSKPWIAAHEICHHYWGEYVPDGDYCGWLWIGLGMMMDKEYSASRGIAPSDFNRAESVLKYHQQGNDTTIWRPIEAFKDAEESDNDYNSIIRHDKSYCVMSMLKQIIGRECFFEIMRHILNEYAGRALRTMDFWRICEEKSGMRLDWFFTDCLHSSRLAGYEIQSIEKDGAATKVKVNSLGEFKFPVHIEARRLDGSILRKQLNRLMDKQVVCFDEEVTDIKVGVEEWLPTILYKNWN